MPALDAQVRASEVAVARICDVNPAFRTCRDQLNGDRSRDSFSFVPDDVRMVTVGIDECHALSIYVRLTVRVGAFIFRHRSRCDDDQAMTGVSVPSGASSRLPYIALDV